MATGTAVSVDLSGPFFQKDPGKTVRGNIEKMMQGLAAEGQASARSALVGGQGARRPIRIGGDRVSMHVIGRTYARPDKGGRRWRASAVVEVYNVGLDEKRAISLMAASVSVEKRTHVFRNLSRAIRSARAVLAANLTDGIE